MFWLTKKACAADGVGYPDWNSDSGDFGKQKHRWYFHKSSTYYHRATYAARNSERNQRNAAHWPLL